MRYVVLGASAAGINGAETLRALDPNAEIILVSQDDKVYSRCILHLYIESSRTVEELNFVDPDFFEKNRIKWIKGVDAIGVDSDKNEVKLSSGEILTYDKLLIATGSHPFMPPIENFRVAKNVVGLKSLEDCRKIREIAREAKNIVVVGGGLIGVDALTGLLHYDADLTLVEMQNHILPLQLDQHTANTYQKIFSERGVTQYYNNGVINSDTDAEGNITRIHLKTGEIIPADLVIVAAGVRANIEFLKESKIEVNKFGLVIDTKGKTNIDNIYGAGDVTGLMPIWPVAVKEAIIAASNMTGKERIFDDFFCSKCTMNFFGIPTLSLGVVEPPDDTFEVDIDMDINGNYKKIIHKNGKIYGGLLQGDIGYAGILTQLIKEKIDISKIKKPIFDIDYSDFFKISENFEFSY